MKKLLLLILTLILGLSICANAGIITFAAEGDTECTHTDGNDNFNNICDNCKEYLGTEELSYGENTVLMTDFYEQQKSLIKYVPEESGLYVFYSTGTDKDPRGYLYNSNLERISFNDDSQWLPYSLDFGFTAELVAGETYYLSVSTSQLNNEAFAERTVIVEKHVTHIDGNNNYNNLCDMCEEFLLDYELELGEHSVVVLSRKYSVQMFTPENSGAYKFILTDAENNPDLLIYKQDFSNIVYSTQETANGSELVADLTANTPYYLLVWNPANNDIEPTVKIESHEHSSDVLTCKGMLCDCGLYYGDETGEHRLGEQTCQGYECIDCYKFFGEKNDNHVNLSAWQTCQGYLCLGCDEYIGEKGEHNLSTQQYCAGYRCADCYGYFGEGTGLHEDGADYSANICDVCGLYIGTVDFSVGDNTLDLIDDKRTYTKFVPANTSTYKLSDTDDTKFYLCIYDSDLQLLTSKYFIYNTNTSFYYDFEAGTTYYFGIDQYNNSTAAKLEIEQHEHSGGEQTCIGYHCSCDMYYGEADETAHEWHSGWCSLCYITCEHDSPPVFVNCVGAVCECGFTNTDLTDPNVHIWNDGQCLACNTMCEHESEPTKHTCIGYLCECGLFYGDNGEEHSDGEDEHIYLCDYCEKEYLGAIDVSVGENIVSREFHEYMYVRFVPTESGVYKLYSTSQYDPYIISYDKNFNLIKVADDENSLNFVLYIELTAGETYYLALYDYRETTEIPFTITTHEHPENDNLPTCMGVFCEECEYYYGETDEDNHVWSYGNCEYHTDIEYPDDLECEHSWDDGECETCGVVHVHESVDSNGYCEGCDVKFYFKVESNGKVYYHYSFDSLYSTLEDGDIVTIYSGAELTDITEIDKKITIDLNGHWFYTRYGRPLYIYEEVKIIDTSDDHSGVADFGIFIYNENAAIEGGAFRYIVYEVEGDFSIADTVGPCTKFYNCSTNEIIDVSTLKTISDCFYVVTDHAEKYICTGVVCDDCGLALDGEGDADNHNFENYELYEDASCIKNATEISTCSWCNEETDVREIENTIVPHKWTPAYGEGYKKCDTCHKIVENKIYSGDSARNFANKVVSSAYDYLKDLVVAFVEDKFGFIFE